MNKVINLGDYAELRRVIREEVRQAIREEVKAAVRDAIGASAPASDMAMRIQDVVKVVGLCDSTIYAMVKAGEFPKSFKLGGNSSAWLASEVQAWILNRAAQARKEA